MSSLQTMGQLRCRQTQCHKMSHKNAFDCWCRHLQSGERLNLGSILLCCMELHPSLSSHKHKSFSRRHTFFHPAVSTASRGAIFTQKSGSRLGQTTAMVCHSFHFFPGLLLSSSHICWLLFGAFALFGAHGSACANVPHLQFLHSSAF